MVFLYILFGFFAVFLFYHFATKKYINPYKLYMVFGKKGSGKTTYLVKLALKYQKQGRDVYTNVDVPGCYKLSKDYVDYEIPAGSVVMIDEAGMVYDNRKYKTFSDAVRDWYKLQRHRHLIVYLFSQDFDIDLKLRQLTDEMYLIRRYFRVLSVARRIDRSIVLHKSTADAPSNITDDLRFVPLLAPSAVKLTYIPRYAKYYDSYDAPPLKPAVYALWRPVPSKPPTQLAVARARLGKSCDAVGRRLVVLWRSVMRSIGRIPRRRRGK